MRISDWSSDGCSFDLGADAGGSAARPGERRLSRHRDPAPGKGLPRLEQRHRPRPHAGGGGPCLGSKVKEKHRLQRPGCDRGSSCRRREKAARDRKSVEEGKSVSVRLELVVRSIIDKQNKR